MLWVRGNGKMLWVRFNGLDVLGEI